MRLIVENRYALFGLVALALVALFGVALVTGPVSAVLGVSEPGTVRPDHAVRVCPAPHESSEAGSESSVAAFAPMVSRDDEGELWAEPVTGSPQGSEDEDEGAGEDGDDGGEPGVLSEELTEPGRVWRTDTGGATDPTAVRAEGSLASGLDSTQTTLSDDGATEVRCAEPAIGTWFSLIGASDADGVELEELTVHMANPEEFRATVSVDVYSMEGPSYSSESRGISLLPGEATQLDLTELIQSGAIGVHVRTSTGRVAASLLAAHASGGTDWVPPARTPARELVVPGVPAGEGTRRLVVTAPGDEPVEARVHVIAAGQEDGEDEAAEEEGDGVGSGTAEDPMVLNIPPAASAWLTLESVLGGEPGAVVVEADGPVAAGVAAEVDDGAETAYTAAVEPLNVPLDTTAVLPDVPEGAGTELVLTAPEEDASVMATPIGADGTQGDAVRVEVAAGSTYVFGPDDDGWDAPPGTDPEDGYAVRLELLEDSAPLYAARVLRTDDGLSVLPVRPAPVKIALPLVRDTMVGVVP